MKLLCISNGHGEDVIALRILDALRQLNVNVELFALPISGVGSPYQNADIEIIGPTQAMPSGGFINRDAKQVVRDVQGGLLSLTRSQQTAIKSWRTQNPKNAAILAVGDIVPQIFAHLSGLPYVFVGTAKSEYWLRDDDGKRPAKTLWERLEGWSGSVYLPWERWLMARPSCRATFVRDALTAKTLQQTGIDAQYEGNPMMDGLASEGKLDGLLVHICESGQENGEPLKIVILPGSRSPEAYENWGNILAALPGLIAAFPDRHIVLLGAIAPTLSPDKLPATANTWQHQSKPYSTFTHQNVTLLLISDAYNDCLHQADIAIATAGTATEQVVGLGKPVITLPGDGPQFTKAFATVQAKMLGPSVRMVETAEDVGSAIAAIISNPALMEQIRQNGKQRMGESGAGKRIAEQLIKALTKKN
ncbi:MAG: lipid-A-disaccharide synthase-related protein [Cyanobacteria bacterium J06627_28]